MDASSCIKALSSGIYRKDARHRRLFTSVDAWAVAVVTPPSYGHSELSYVTFYLLCSFTSSDLGWFLPCVLELRATRERQKKYHYFDIWHQKTTAQNDKAPEDFDSDLQTSHLRLETARVRPPG